MRTASLSRSTRETEISVRLDLDGRGEADIATGVGFFDHMLTQIARHGLFDLEVKARGDLHIDDHHTVEDVGIALGQCFRKALGDMEQPVFAPNTIVAPAPMCSRINLNGPSRTYEEDQAARSYDDDHDRDERGFDDGSDEDEPTSAFIRIGFARRPARH